jgi:hypothetical protein
MRMVAFVKAEPSEQPVTDAKMNATQASSICSQENQQDKQPNNYKCQNWQYKTFCDFT